MGEGDRITACVFGSIFGTVAVATLGGAAVWWDGGNPFLGALVCGLGTVAALTAAFTKQGD